MKSGPWNAENGNFQRVQFQKFPGGGGMPPDPLISSRLQFVPSAFMPTSFPYESSTLKCYQKTCSRTLPYHHPIHKTTSFTATILAQKRVCSHFPTYVTHVC